MRVDEADAVVVAPLRRRAGHVKRCGFSSLHVVWHCSCLEIDTLAKSAIERCFKCLHFLADFGQFVLDGGDVAFNAFD